MIIGIEANANSASVAVVNNGVIKSMHTLALDALIDYVAEHAVVGGDVVINESPFVEPIITALAHRNVVCTRAKPLAARVISRSARKNSAYFRKLTGWHGKTSEAHRDAVLIALYGVRGANA